jgi:hypothetical protein
MSDGSVTFAWFVENRFLPLKEAAWKEETTKTKKILIQRDLIDPLGEIPLVKFDKFSLQLHLNKLAITRSKDRVLQMRAYVRDIFAEAVDQGFLTKDPARKVKVPTQLRETDTTTLTWDQLGLALMELTLRNRILLELDMTNALRPSELLAFRWKCFDYDACTLKIMETVYKGKIRPWGKTKKVSRSFTFRGSSRTIWRHGVWSVRNELERPRPKTGRSLRFCCLRTTSSLPTMLEGSSIPTIFGAGASQTGPRSGTAEADVSSHPAHDCDSGSEEGHRQGRAGLDATFSHGNHHRHLHAGNSGRRARDD